MKRTLTLLFIFVLCTSCVIAKEKLTPEEKIQQKCGALINTALQNNDTDSTISAYECLYKQYRKYHYDNMKNAKNLHTLYAEKYANSLESPYYFGKMKKYAFDALRKGSKDPYIADCALLYAIKSSNTYEIDEAFQYLVNISPQKAADIKNDVLKVKQIIKQQETAEAARQAEIRRQQEEQKAIREQAQRDEEYRQDYLNEIRNLNWNMQQIDSNLNSIDSNLDGLRWGY